MIQHALDINNDINNCVELPKEVRLFNQSFTIEFWIYYKTQGKRQTIIGDVSVSGSTDTNFEIYSDNTLRLYWNHGEIDDKFNILEQNKWIHIAWVRDKENDNQIFYKNGKKIYETNKAGSDLNGTSILWLGRDGRSEMVLNAIIDELRIWNCARTQESIKNNMNKIVSTYSNGLFAYYRFDNDKNNIIKDYTQNNNSGYTSNINLTTNIPILVYYKFLLKQNNQYYSIKNYQNGQFQPLTLEGGEQPNEADYENFGFNNVNDLLISQNTEIIQGIDKGELGEGKYFEVELVNEIKKVNNIELK